MSFMFITLQKGEYEVPEWLSPGNFMCTAYMIGLKNARTRIFARIEAISVRTFTRNRRGKVENRRAKRAER